MHHARAGVRRLLGGIAGLLLCAVNLPAQSLSRSHDISPAPVVAREIAFRGPRLELRSGLSQPAPRPRWRADSTDSVAVSRGHWKTGMIVGAAGGVVVTGYVYELARGVSDSPVRFNPLGALLIVGTCSLLGGLIGSMFH